MTHKTQSDLVQERFTRTAGEFAAFSQKVRTAEAAQLLGMLRECVKAESESGSGTSGGKSAPNEALAVRGMRALDVACGPGTFTLVFAPQVARMTGLDITAAILQKARAAAEREGLNQIEWLLGNAEKLPWEAASFDLVTTAYSLHHIGNAAQAVSEMARVLRPGGWLALVDICVPDAAGGASGAAAESSAFDVDANNAIEIARDASHVRTFRPAELRALAERVGLRVARGEPGARERSFDDWMQIAGWKRGDAAYAETRRLLEQHLEHDRSGFAPRRASSPPDNDLQWTQWSYFFVARKSGAGSD